MANIAKSAILRAKIGADLVELLVKTKAAQVIVDDKGTTLEDYLLTLAKTADLETLQQTVNGLGALASKSEVTYDELADTLKTLIDGKVDKTTYDAFVLSANETMVGVGDRLNALDGEEGRVKAVEDRLDTAEGSITTHAQAIETINTTLNTMYGITDESQGDSGKSIRTIAIEELAKQLITEDAAENLDTLKEIAAWIQSHPNEVGDINKAIDDLEKKVELGTDTEGTEYATVKAYVEAYVAGIVSSLNLAQYAKSEDLGALAGKDKVSQTDLDDALAETFATVTGVVGALAGDDAGKSAREIAGEVLEGANLGQYAKTEDLGDLAALDEVGVDNLSDALKEIINDVQTQGPHTHDNKAELDSITADHLAAWNSKTRIHYASGDVAPAGMVEGDLWVQLLD